MSNEWLEMAKSLLRAHVYFIEVALQLDVTLRNKARVCGEWSPREVVAHLVGWDAEAARGLGLFASGRGDDFTPVGIDGIDDFNSHSVSSRKHLSWDAVVSELKIAQQELQDMIKVVHAKRLNSDSGFGKWLIGRIEDYDYHTQQLLLWVPAN